MPLELIHATIALAFLAICVMAGDILVRERRAARTVAPLRKGSRVDGGDTLPLLGGRKWHVNRARGKKRARDAAGA